MTNKTLLFILSLAFANLAFGQRLAYIESEFILERVTPYKLAKEKLEKQSQEWQKEIQGKMKDLDVLYKKFQAEQALYTDAIRKQKVAEIEDKEKEIGELQNMRFGPGGDVFKKRQELIQPIINQMYDEVKKYSESKGLDFVIDKSNGNSVIYNNPKLNISEQIVKAMGY